MKKKAILALTMAGLVALQMPMVAMADVTYPITSGGTYETDLNAGEKYAVEIKTSGETLIVNGNVQNAGSSALRECTVYINAESSAEISGSVVNNGYSSAINASGSASVKADSVSNVRFGPAVCADSATVEVTKEVKSVYSSAIKAYSGATVTAGSATNTADNNSQATIYATDTNTLVSVKATEGVEGATGAVTNNGTGKAIEAENGATVTAESATNTSDSEATVFATGKGGETDPAKQTNVTVTGAVTNNGTRRAIEASNGATVIAGSATSGAEGQGTYAPIMATGPDTTVIIEAKDGVEGATGDVTNKGDGGAVWVKSGATVVIEGTAKNNSGQETVALDNENSKVIVYKIENTGVSSQLIDGDDQNVFYIIKGTDSTGIDLANTTGLTAQTVLDKTYQTAVAETEIRVAVESGYEVKAGTIEVTKNADGTYSIKVPVGGGVTLETIKKAVEAAQAQAEAEEKKATVTGSEGNAVGGGSWNCGPGGYWTYRNGGIFKDTWGCITLEDGRTGWFWFDKNGVMATGWKEISGKWYYFNEVHDGTYGMMLVNTTTPDGKQVGADGAMIQ